MFPRLPSIAVLDDEPDFRVALSRLLKSHGFQVQLFATGPEFLASLFLESFDCLLLDLHMPRTTGFDLLLALRARKASFPVIVITGCDQPGMAAACRTLGAANYLIKPVDESALLATLAQAMAPQSPA